MVNRVTSSRLTRAVMALAVVALLAAGGFLALSLTPGQADVAHAQADVPTLDDITITKSAQWPSDNTFETGDTATYTVTLDKKPTPYVAVSPVVTNTNANFTVSPAVHWFTKADWEAPEPELTSQTFTFTVTAAQDDNDSVGGSASIHLKVWIYTNEDDADVHSTTAISVIEKDVSECPTIVISEGKESFDTFRVTGQTWRWNTDASNWGDRYDCSSQAQMRPARSDDPNGRQVSWVPAQYYEFKVPAPARDVTITMETDNLDPALFLRRGTKTGDVLARDANLKFTNGKRVAWVRQNLSAGTYVIEATTPGWNQEWDGSEPRVGQFKITVTGLNADTTTSPECDVSAVSVGSSASATWDGSCDSYYRKPYGATYRSNARWYTFNVGARALYTITLNAEENNSYLILRRGADNKHGAIITQNGYDAARGVAYNYDFPWDARIQRWLDPGDYTVQATNVRTDIDPPHETGPFTLNVKMTLLVPRPLWGETPSATGRSLDLRGWNPTSGRLTGVNQDVPWHYQANTGPHATCSAAQTVTALDLTGLSPNTSYTYTAYQDAGCTDMIASWTFKTPPVLVFNPGYLSVPEGNTATYTVKLRSQPTANVSVAITAGTGDSDITVKDTDDSTDGDQTTAITFAPDNWNTARTITLAAAADADYLDGSRTINHAVTSADANFNGETAKLTATEQENDKGIVLNPMSLSVPEAGTATYTVRLSVAPNADVEVTVGEGPGDGDITVSSPADKKLTFTSSNWKTPQSVTLSADDDQDSIVGTRTITHSASGGGYANVTANLTAIEDENDKMVEFRNAGDTADIMSLSVPEGGSATYGVKLNMAPDADVTVALSATGGDEDITFNPASLTFTTANYAIVQTVTVSAAADNDDVGNGTKTITHAASGGGYDSVSANLTATEADDDTAAAAIVLSAATVGVAEDDTSGTYTVKLSHRPGADVTVTLTEGTTAPNNDNDITVLDPSGKTMTFTTTGWDTAQTVTLGATDDNDIIQGSRDIIHTASAAGGYTASVTATITATEIENDKGVILSKTALTVKEGGSATYTVRLSVQPSDNVTVTVAPSGNVGADTDITVSPSLLTFTGGGNGNWSTPQTVTVRAASDADTTAGTRMIGHATSSSGDSGYHSPDTSSVDLTVTESEPPLLVQSATDSSNITTLSVPEGSSSSSDFASYKVKLSAQPSSNVTVYLDLQSTSGNNAGDANISRSPSSLTFTPDNYDTAQTVKVYASEDGDMVNGSRKITHRVSGGGYNNAGSIVLTATEAENDNAIIFRNAADTAGITSVSVPEDSTATYKVELSAVPNASVTVAIVAATGGSNDTDITVSPASLTFSTSDWNDAKTVTLTAAVDDDLLNGSRAITHTASGANSGYANVTASLTATEADNDTGEIVISDPDTTDALALGDVPEGSTATYHVALSKQPRADVTVTIAEASGGDTDITVTSPSNKKLTFTAQNWDTTQSVTLSAAEDSGAAMDGTRTITHTASGSDSGYAGVTKNQTAKELDNDKTVILMDAGENNDISSIIVAEGTSTTTYKVKLGHAPSGGNVTVTLTKSNQSNASITFNPVSLTFTPNNHGTLQTVTITAAADNSNNVNGVATITHTASGGRFHNITAALTVKENDDENNVTPTAQEEATQPPASVGGLSASRSSGSIEAGWDAVDGATKYHVTYTDNGGSSWSLAAGEHSTTSITIGNADDGKAYIVGVRAGNDAGWSGWVNSNTVPPVASPPAGVGSVSAGRSGGNITASWNAVSGATKYHVTYTDNGGGSWTSAADAQTGTSITISGADDGKAYIVGVRAGNDAGWSGWVNSNEVPAVVSPPGSVGSVSATHNGGTVTASWSAPDGATKYHVTYSDDGGQSWSAAADAHTGTSITISGADSGKEYIVGVRAGNGAGWSGWVNSPPAKYEEGAGASTQ